MVMTKLEAVNIALDAIGEASVSTLSSGTEDAETAQRMLGETTREILSEGWHFNQRKTYLTRDSGNRFVVPGNALSVDTIEEHAYIDVIAVGGYVFNKIRETNVWTSPQRLRVELVLSFDFSELPFLLQNYIARANAVKFQRSVVGSVSRDSFVYQEFMAAKSAALSDDNLTQDPNMIHDNPGSYAALYRPNRFFGL